MQSIALYFIILISHDPNILLFLFRPMCKMQIFATNFRIKWNELEKNVPEKEESSEWTEFWIGIIYKNSSYNNHRSDASIHSSNQINAQFAANELHIVKLLLFVCSFFCTKNLFVFLIIICSFAIQTVSCSTFRVARQPSLFSIHCGFLYYSGLALA